MYHVFRFEEAMTVFDPPNGPYYRCIFTIAPPDLAGCAESVPWHSKIIGLIRSTEVLKIALGIGDLSASAARSHALEEEFRE
ncbi:MAG: hypothetical protein R2855_04740 [Thermomicrobiales bacterium]